MTDDNAASDDALHQVLADWLVGRGSCSAADALARHGVEAVLAACEREGVVSLVHALLSEGAVHTPVPSELLESLALRARQCAARSLLCQAEARRIQQALTAAGIPAVWLKGITLGHWLYPSMHLRDVADIDLLLPDHATALRAADVLATLGYQLPNRHIAGDLVVHELLAWSERAQLELDLHWDVSNDALFAGRLPWEALARHAIPLPGLGAGARGLGPWHALLHACMHRAANHLTKREGRLRWLYDIHLLASCLDAAGWARMAEDAVPAGLADATRSGLEASASVFGTHVPEGVMDRLRTHARQEIVAVEQLRSWGYFQWATWQVLPDTTVRLRWLRQLLFPDFAHLRERYGADGAGAPTLVARRAADGVARLLRYIGRT